MKTLCGFLCVNIYTSGHNIQSFEINTFKECLCGRQGATARSRVGVAGLSLARTPQTCPETVECARKSGGYKKTRGGHQLAFPSLFPDDPKVKQKQVWYLESLRLTCLNTKLAKHP